MLAICESCSVPWERKVPEREASVLTTEVVEFIQSCLDGMERQTSEASLTAKRIRPPSYRDEIYR